jgi:hypothetical protein
MILQSGSADVSTYFVARLVADGTEATGLTPADFDLQYTRSGAAASTKADAILNINGVGGAHVDNTVIEVDATDSPGLYRVDWPDAAFAAGVGEVVLVVNVATAFSEHLRVTLSPPVDVVAIDGDEAAGTGLKNQFDGTTGLTGDTYPATQAQVGNISSGTAAINTVAESFTKVGAEPETNTYTSTHNADGVYHIVEDDTGTTDAYYQFDLGGNGVPVSITWDGYAQSQGDSYDIYAYNWVTTSWDQVGTVIAANGTTQVSETWDLITAHVGTSANLGKVRLRFYSTDGTAFATDRMLCSYALVSQSVGYQNGAIWIDTVNGTAGTEVFVNGTADNPVDTIADALTIAASLGLHNLQIAPGSSITLGADMTGYTMRGDKWTLALNSQTITDCYIYGALASGTYVATSNPVFDKCNIGAVTGPPLTAFSTAFASTVTFNGTGTVLLHQSMSGVAGGGAPVFDCGAAVGNLDLNFRAWSGGVDLRNFGQAGTDKMTLEGFGQLILNANCIGGEVQLRGSFKLNDNSGGLVDVDDSANVTNEGYAGGYVYIDTANGTAGTVPYVNGTVNNPVDSLADAITLASALNFTRFFCVPQTSITLAGDMANYEFDGISWSLACGGYDLSNSYIKNAFVSGISTSDTQNAYFERCFMFGATIGSAVLRHCAIHTSLTLTEANSVTMTDCYQAAGGGVPYLDYSVTGANAQIDRWSGNLEVRSMVAGDTIQLYGLGGFVIHSGCTGGVATIAGSITVTDNASGAVTVSQAANYLDSNINAEVVDVMTVDTGTEVASVPAAAPSFREMVQFLYQKLRNEEVGDSGAGTQKIAKSDGTVIGTSTVTDAAGVFTKGKYA